MNNLPPVGALVAVGHRFAYIREAERGRTQVCVDGQRGTMHAGIVSASLRFSDNHADPAS